MQLAFCKLIPGGLGCSERSDFQPGIGGGFKVHSLCAHYRSGPGFYSRRQLENLELNFDSISPVRRLRGGQYQRLGIRHRTQYRLPCSAPMLARLICSRARARTMALASMRRAPVASFLGLFPVSVNVVGNGRSSELKAVNFAMAPTRIANTQQHRAHAGAGKPLFCSHL